MNNYHLLIQKDKNKPKGKLLVTSSLDDLANGILNNYFSVGFYNPPYRDKSSWRKTNILAFDIDEKQQSTMNDVHFRLEGLNHIIGTSKSHTKQHNRYRLLVFLDDYVNDYSFYTFLHKEFAKEYGFIPDKKANDATHLFFNCKRIEFVNKNAELFNFIYIKNKFFNENDKTNQSIKEKKPFRFSEFELSPEIMSFIDRTQERRPSKRKLERFIRWILAQRDFMGFNPETREFLGKGFNYIPQQVVADQIPVDRGTLRKWINLLIEHDLLEVADDSYGKGYKAKEYRLKGDLKKLMMENYIQENHYDYKSLPSEIEDGNWDRDLFKYVWYFRNDDTPERFYNWAKNLSTFQDKKDRNAKVEWAWKQMKKYLST